MPSRIRTFQLSAVFLLGLVVEGRPSSSGNCEGLSTDAGRGRTRLMRAAEIAFVGALVYGNPWLVPILQEHVDDNDGVLPHLLLADVERWAETRLQSHGATDDQLRCVLGFLESGYAAGDPHIEELISVSFLELLPRQDEPLAELRDLVGPHLRKQLEIIA